MTKRKSLADATGEVRELSDIDVAKGWYSWPFKAIARKAASSKRSSLADPR